MDLFPPPPVDEPRVELAPPPPPADDRLRIPAWLIGTTAVLVLAGMLAGFLFLWQRADELDGDLGVAQRRIEQLSSDLGDAAEAQGALAGRIQELERKVGEQVDFVALARAVRPSVFTIEAADSLGSGFVVENTGGVSVLVTNFHVIAGVGRGGSVRVLQEGRPAARGVVTATDEENDLAIVEVNRSYPALRASTRPPQPGDPVAVVGSPLGLAGTVTDGIVSGFRSGLLQFSAPVSPGNSGGPVVDRTGRVIGIAVLKIAAFGAEGLSFAVPIEQLCERLLSC
ncbi:MAG TPA: S1C family serine protease [Actinomycetota bacterium]